MGFAGVARTERHIGIRIARKRTQRTLSARMKRQRGGWRNASATSCEAFDLAMEKLESLKALLAERQSPA